MLQIKVEEMGLKILVEFTETTQTITCHPLLSHLEEVMEVARTCPMASTVSMSLWPPFRKSPRSLQLPLDNSLNNRIKPLTKQRSCGRPRRPPEVKVKLKAKKVKTIRKQCPKDLHVDLEVRGHPQDKGGQVEAVEVTREDKTTR